MADEDIVEAYLVVRIKGHGTFVRHILGALRNVSHRLGHDGATVSDYVLWDDGHATWQPPGAFEDVQKTTNDVFDLARRLEKERNDG